MMYSQLRELCISKIDEILHDAEIFNRMYSQVISMEPDEVRKEQFLHICAEMEDLYREFLKNQWNLLRGEDIREFHQIMDKPYMRMCIDEEYRDPIASALEDSQIITWWEKITDTNKQDEALLKNTLLNYARCQLGHMMNDFLEDVPLNPLRK